MSNDDFWVAASPWARKQFRCDYLDKDRCGKPIRRIHVKEGETPKDNTADMIAKGRNSRGMTHGEAVRAARQRNADRTTHATSQQKGK